MSLIRLDENAVVPGTPSAGTSIIYPKSDGLWYTKDDAGTETALGAASPSANALLKDGSVALTANWDAGAFTITAAVLASDVAIGTAPLTVTSTTLVTNLNADLLDSQSGSFYTSASNLNAGTLPDARFPATLPAASGANLTALNASNLGSGTVPLARISSLTNTEIAAGAAIAWTKLSKTGSSLADLTTRSASDLSSGTLPDARFPATLPAVSGVNLTNLTSGNLSGNLIAGICCGRLTLETGVPVSTADQTAKTTIYFTPFRGNQVGLYTGSAWVLHTLTELSLAVPATTSTIYDVFLDYNAGTPQLVATAWTNDTTRATELTTQDGVLVQTGNTDWRYLGSFRTTSVSGQTEDSVAKRLLWNYYHQQPRPLRRIETTASWTYSTATMRQARGSTDNQVETVIGVAGSMLSLSASVEVANSTTLQFGAVAIGEGSTTAAAANQVGGVGRIVTVPTSPLHATLHKAPAVGYQFWAWLEYPGGSGGVTTWYSSNVINNNSGLSGWVEG